MSVWRAGDRVAECFFRKRQIPGVAQRPPRLISGRRTTALCGVIGLYSASPNCADDPKCSAPRGSLR
jgi:hypothetical protein